MGILSLFRSRSRKRRSRSKRRSKRSKKRFVRKRSPSKRRKARRSVRRSKRRSKRSKKRSVKRSRFGFSSEGGDKFEFNTMKECIHCVHLKDYLKKIGVDFGSGRKVEGKYPHTLYQTKHNGNSIVMKEYSMRSAPSGSYPQMFRNGKEIGSQEELKSLLN